MFQIPSQSLIHQPAAPPPTVARLPRALSFLSLAPVPACTTVSVTQNDGEMRVERAFGAVHLHLEPAAEATVARTRALGFLDSPIGVGVGYVGQDLMALPRDGRIVLWVDERTDLDAWLRRLGELDGVCPVRSAGIDSDGQKGEDKSGEPWEYRSSLLEEAYSPPAPADQIYRWFSARAIPWVSPSAATPPRAAPSLPSAIRTGTSPLFP